MSQFYCREDELRKLKYGEKTCTGIKDAIKAGICSDANKK